ncbi:MAG: hypothetical protein QOJ99_5554 [Bryobacterales bacterium]|nr:hypothetical protein [Bryobacterales bacterium]MEA2475742.1 hypothetical protein [Thermoleophilaceae bacterium]
MGRSGTRLFFSLPLFSSPAIRKTSLGSDCYRSALCRSWHQIPCERGDFRLLMAECGWPDGGSTHVNAAAPALLLLVFLQTQAATTVSDSVIAS